MKTALTGLAVCLGLIGTLWGFITFAGLPPYMAVKDHAEDMQELEMEVVGNQIQVYDYRQYNLQREIWNLEERKARMLETPQGRQEWFRIWERRLKELHERKEKNKHIIEKYEKRLEPRGK